MALGHVSIPPKPCWIERIIKLKNEHAALIQQHINSLPPLPGAHVAVRDMFNAQLDAEACANLSLGHSQLFQVANLAGVMASKEFKKGDVVCYYFGWVVTPEEYDEMVDVRGTDIHCSTAVHYLNDFVLIGYPNRVASFINDPRRGLHPLQANCKFSVSHVDGIRVVALKQIRLGEEILISYGQNYWTENQLNCYLCMKRAVTTNNPIIHCSGVHRRKNQLVNCSLSAHCSCLGAPATQQRFRCYVCCASDSGWVNSSSNAITARTEMITSCLSGSIPLANATLLPATLPSSQLVEYCLNRIVAGTMWGLEQVKGKNKPRNILKWATSEIIPTLYVVSMIIRHLRLPQQQKYMKQVIDLNNQWFNAYADDYATEDIWLYPLAAFDQTDSVLPTCKYSIETLITESLTMPKLAEKANKKSGNHAKKFIIQFSYLWLRSTCAGNDQLWESFKQNAATSLHTFVKRAKEFRLTYNKRAALVYRLDDVSIDYVYCITHLVFWLSNWCTAVIPSDVVQPRIAMEAVTLMTSWIKDEIDKDIARLEYNHELWGELAVSSITLIMGLSYDQQCENSMKYAIRVLAAYYSALKKAFDNADPAELDSAANGLSLFVPSDFDRALILDVNLHTHLIIAWFATLMPEFKEFVLRPSTTCSSAPQSFIKSSKRTDFTIPSAPTSSKKGDIHISSANVQLMTYGNVNLETMLKTGYIFATRAFEHNTIDALRRSIVDEVSLLANDSKPVDFTVQVDGGMLVTDGRIVLSQALQTTLLAFARCHVKALLGHLGDAVRLLEVTPKPSKTDPHPEKGCEMFLRLKGPGTGTCPHYDTAHYLRENNFNEDFLPDTFVTCWIPLHDVDAADGGLCLLKDSNKRYVSFEAALKEKKYERPSNTEDLNTWLVANFKAGDCVIFPGTMVHGAFNNKTAETRLSLDVRVVIPRSLKKITRSTSRSLSAEFEPQVVHAQPSTHHPMDVVAPEHPSLLNDSHASTDTDPQSVNLSPQSENAEIEDILEYSGYHFVEVLGDGHCFYRCIAIAQLRDESLFRDVRKQVHDWLKEHMNEPDIRRELNISVEYFDYDKPTTVADYINKITSETPFPAGIPEILAASTIFGIMIKVIHHEQTISGYSQGLQPELADDYAFQKGVNSPAERTTLLFHCVDRNHINLITTDANQASEWRKLSEAYKRHKSRLGGIVGSLPVLPVAIDDDDVVEDLEAATDAEMERKYDDDTNDEDYELITEQCDQSKVEQDTSPANIINKTKKMRRKSFQLRQAAEPPSTHNELLQLQAQHWQDVEAAKTNNKGLRRAWKTVINCRKQQRLKDNAAFESIDISDIPLSRLEYLKLSSFYAAVDRIKKHCGNVKEQEDLVRLAPLQVHADLFKERLSVRSDWKWDNDEQYNWEIKCWTDRQKRTADGTIVYEDDKLVYKGLHICSKCFCDIYGLKPKTFEKRKQQAKNGQVNRAHASKNVKKCGTKSEDAELVMNAVVLPEIEYIPNSRLHNLKIPREEVFDRVRKQLKEQIKDPNKRKQFNIGNTTLKDVYEKLFGDFISKGRTHGMARCDTCQRFDNELKRAKGLDQKQLAKAKEQHHNNHRNERLYMEHNIKAATENPNQSMMVLIDGMDQAKTDMPKIKKSDQAKGLDSQNTLKTRITGALVFGGGGPPRLYYYLTYGDEVHVNPNLTVTVLMDVLDKTRRGIPWVQKYDDAQLREHGLLPRDCYGPNRALPAKLTVQLDNTCKENKNATVMNACAYLVRMDFVKEVHVNFLVTGHTHSHIDQTFSCVSQRISKYNVYTVESLVEHMRSSYTLAQINDNNECELEFDPHDKKDQTMRKINELLNILQNGLAPEVTILRRTTDFTRWFESLGFNTKWVGVTKCHQFKFTKSSEYTTDQTVFMTARQYASQLETNKIDVTTSNTISILPANATMPTTLPFLEPNHKVDTDALMKCVNTCSNNLGYFQHQGPEYRSFKELCDNFDIQAKSMCQVCAALRDERKKLVIEKPKLKDAQTSEEVKKLFNKIATGIKDREAALTQHMANLSVNDSHHPRTELSIIIEAVQGEYLLMKPFNDDDNDEQDQLFGMAAGNSIHALNNNLSLAERSVTGPRVYPADAEYQDRSKEIKKGMIVVVQSKSAFHYNLNIQQHPGYPFSMALVTSVQKRTAAEPHLLKLTWFVRAFDENENELLEWYRDIKIAKEKNYCIAEHIGELEVYQYRKEVQNNEHTTDARRVLRKHGIPIPGEPQQPPMDEQNIVAQPQRKKRSKTRNTDSAAESEQKQQSGRRSTRQRGRVNYNEDSDQDASSSDDEKRQPLNELITDVDLGDNYFQHVKNLDFSFHFQARRGDKPNIPRGYVRAKDCDVIIDDVNIQQWYWSTDINNVFGTAQSSPSECLVWDTPENVFKQFKPSNNNSTKGSKRQQQKEDPWISSYQLKPKFLRIIKCEMENLYNHAAQGDKQQQAIDNRNQHRALMEQRIRELQQTAEMVNSRSLAPISSLSNITEAAVAPIMNARINSKKPDKAMNPAFKRIMHAISERMHCVHQVCVGDSSSSLHRRYWVCNQRVTDIYQVDITHNPTCTCPDYDNKQKITHCKHINYVLIRVLKCVDIKLVHDMCYCKDVISTANTQRIRDELHRLYRTTYTDQDIQALFDNQPAPLTEQQLAAVNNKRPAPVRPESPTVPMKEIEQEESCCICYDDMTIEQQIKQELVYCKRSCAVNIHRSCFLTFKDYRNKQSLPLTCPHCRSPWT